MHVGDKIARKPHQTRGQRPGGNLNGSLSTKIGWMRGDIFTLAKLLANEFAMEHAGSLERLVYNSDWAPIGVHYDSLLAQVTVLLPDFLGVYAQGYRTRTPLCALLHSRVYNMYRIQKPDPERPLTNIRREGLSTEHPLHPDTKIQPGWYHYAQDVWRAQRPVFLGADGGLPK